MNELYRALAVLAMWLMKILMWIGPLAYATRAYRVGGGFDTAIYVAIGSFVCLRWCRDFARNEADKGFPSWRSESEERV